MLLFLYPLNALNTPFPKTFTIKGSANNGRNTPSCPFSTLLTLFPVEAFINEEATGWINEDVICSIKDPGIGPIIAPRNPPSPFIYFMFFCFCSTIN